jgi:hypothetical protein
LALGIAKSSTASPSSTLEQTFATPLAVGTKIIVKATRADNLVGSIAFKHITSNGSVQGSNITIDPAVGFAEYTVVTSPMVKIRIELWAFGASITDASVFQGAIAGGSVQTYAGGGLEKISGVDGWNAGASSTASLGGNSNGYVQFQYAVASKALKIGFVVSDVDFADADPYELQIVASDGSVITDGTSQSAGFASQGDWFRIRHYASSNEIQFQRKQEIFDNGVSVGFDYVTFDTHSVLTTGANLFVDTSFYHNTARINDVTIVS